MLNVMGEMRCNRRDGMTIQTSKHKLRKQALAKGIRSYDFLNYVIIENIK